MDKELLEAIGQMMDSKLEAVKTDMAQMMTEELEPIDKRLAKLEDFAQTTRTAVLNLELVDAPKIHAALDGLSVSDDRLDRHETRITALEDMTERNTIEITGLKQAR